MHVVVWAVRTCRPKAFGPWFRAGRDHDGTAESRCGWANCLRCRCVGGLSYAKPDILKRRADFLHVAKAKRMPCPAFLVQACPRGDEAAFRVGFTCSKKVGNAVMRNRAKRRLREIARLVMARHGRAGWDYVLVGRPDATVSRDFGAMCADLERVLQKLHGAGQ